MNYGPCVIAGLDTHVRDLLSLSHMKKRKAQEPAELDVRVVLRSRDADLATALKRRAELERRTISQLIVIKLREAILGAVQ